MSRAVIRAHADAKHALHREQTEVLRHLGFFNVMSRFTESYEGLT
jgi:hypothetical protein